MIIVPTSWQSFPAFNGWSGSHATSISCSTETIGEEYEACCEIPGTTVPTSVGAQTLCTPGMNDSGRTTNLSLHSYTYQERISGVGTTGGENGFTQCWTNAYTIPGDGCPPAALQGEDACCNGLNCGEPDAFSYTNPGAAELTGRSSLHPGTPILAYRTDASATYAQYYNRPEYFTIAARDFANVIAGSEATGMMESGASSTFTLGGMMGGGINNNTYLPTPAVSLGGFNVTALSPCLGVTKQTSSRSIELIAAFDPVYKTYATNETPPNYVTFYLPLLAASAVHDRLGSVQDNNLVATFSPAGTSGNLATQTIAWQRGSVSIANSFPQVTLSPGTFSSVTQSAFSSITQARTTTANASTHTATRLGSFNFDGPPTTYAVQFTPTVWQTYAAEISPGWGASSIASSLVTFSGAGATSTIGGLASRNDAQITAMLNGTGLGAYPQFGLGQFSVPIPRWNSFSATTFSAYAGSCSSSETAVRAWGGETKFCGFRYHWSPALHNSGVLLRNVFGDTAPGGHHLIVCSLVESNTAHFPSFALNVPSQDTSPTTTLWSLGVNSIAISSTWHDHLNNFRQSGFTSGGTTAAVHHGPIPMEKFFTTSLFDNASVINALPSSAGFPTANSAGTFLVRKKLYTTRPVQSLTSTTGFYEEDIYELTQGTESVITELSPGFRTTIARLDFSFSSMSWSNLIAGAFNAPPTNWGIFTVHNGLASHRTMSTLTSGIFLATDYGGGLNPNWYGTTAVGVVAISYAGINAVLSARTRTVPWINDRFDFCGGTDWPGLTPAADPSPLLNYYGNEIHHNPRMISPTAYYHERRAGMVGAISLTDACPPPDPGSS